MIYLFIFLGLLLAIIGLSIANHFVKKSLAKKEAIKIEKVRLEKGE